MKTTSQLPQNCYSPFLHFAAKNRLTFGIHFRRISENENPCMDLHGDLISVK